MIPISYVAIKKKIEKQFGGEAVLRMAVKKAVSNLFLFFIIKLLSIAQSKNLLFTKIKISLEINHSSFSN